MIRHVTFEETIYSDPPAKFEAGTPNIADAVGLGNAIDYITRLGMSNIERYEHDITAYATDRLARIPGLRPIGTALNKVSVLSFILDDIHTGRANVGTGGDCRSRWASLRSTESPTFWFSHHTQPVSGFLQHPCGGSQKHPLSMIRSTTARLKSSLMMQSPPSRTIFRVGGFCNTSSGFNR
jgi:Aminotransferase class-V